jgi:hypothetical protein
MMDPTHRANISAALTKLWADPARRQRMMSRFADPAMREKFGAETKARWADPLMREKMIEGMKGKKKHRKGTRASRG